MKHSKKIIMFFVSRNRTIQVMATQLVGRGPNPDILSSKFGPRPTIGPKFRPSYFFVHGTHCHVQHPIPQFQVKTFFYWSSIKFWSSKAVKTYFFYFWSSCLKPDFVLHYHIPDLSKFSQLSRTQRFFARRVWTRDVRSGEAGEAVPHL